MLAGQTNEGKNEKIDETREEASSAQTAERGEEPTQSKEDAATTSHSGESGEQVATFAAPQPRAASISDYFSVNLNGTTGAYRTYDIANGAPLSLLDVKINVNTKDNDAIPGGKIVLPLSGKGDSDTEYFTLDHVEGFPADSAINNIIDWAGIERDDANGVLIIPFKAEVPTNATADFVVYYKFDSQYKSKVLPGTVLWQNFGAKLTMDGAADSQALSPSKIKTDATDDSYLSYQSLTPVLFVSGSLSNLRTMAFRDNEYKINWVPKEEFTSTRRLYFPKGTTVDVTEFHYVAEKSTAEEDCYELTSNDFNVLNNTVNSDMDMRDVNFILPETSEVDKIFTVRLEYEYKLVGAEPTVKKAAIDYRTVDGSQQELITSAYHSTGGRDNAISDTARGSVSRLSVYACGLGVYSHSAATKNPATVDATGVKSTLTQPAGTAKANFNLIWIQAARENTDVPWNSYDYSYDLMNADGSKAETVSGRFTPTNNDAVENYSILANHPDKQPTLGQYIDNVTMVPVNTSIANGEGHMMPRNGSNFLYQHKAWDDGHWPDSTLVDPAGTTLTMRATVAYNNVDGTPHEPVSTAYNIYYASSPTFPMAALVMNDALGNSKNPGETVKYQLQLGNSQIYGATVWKNPVIAFKAPEYLSVQSMSQKIAGVDVPLAFTSLGNSNYVVRPGGEVAVDLSISRKIDITFNISGGKNGGTAAPAGTYGVRQVLTASDSGALYTSCINALGAYNTLPEGETAADYGLADNANFILQNNTGGVVGGVVTGGIASTPYTVKSFTSVTGASSIWTNTTGTWVKESTQVATEKNNDAKIKLQLTNSGNAPVAGVRLYDVISQITQDGKASFSGVENDTGWTKYYYTGDATPALGNLTGIDPTGAGWSTTPSSDAKAVMMEYTGDFATGKILEPVLKFKVEQDDVTVTNQYSYCYTAGGLTQTAFSKQHGFSTRAYIVNFEANVPEADTSVENMPEAITGDMNGNLNVTIPSEVPTRDDYTFGGWYDNADCTGDIWPDNFAVSKQVTSLYAKWNPRPVYAVSYNGNFTGASAETRDSKWNKIEAQSYMVSIEGGNLIPRSGYTFKEWNTATDGTGTAFAPGASRKVEANLDLYAIWGGKVTYARGADTAIEGALPSDDTIYVGENATVKAGSGLSKTGYHFMGWSTEDQSSNAQYTANQSFEVEKDVTLYPVFAIKTVAITYEVNGGASFSPAVGSTTADYEGEIQTNPGTPTREGYLFGGWASSAVSSWVFGAGGTIVSPANGVTDADASPALTLTAKWVQPTATKTELRINTNNEKTLDLKYRDFSALSPEDFIQYAGINTDGVVGVVSKTVNFDPATFVPECNGVTASGTVVPIAVSDGTGRVDLNVKVFLIDDTAPSITTEVTSIKVRQDLRGNVNKEHLIRQFGASYTDDHSTLSVMQSKETATIIGWDGAKTTGHYDMTIAAEDEAGNSVSASVEVVVFNEILRVKDMRVSTLDVIKTFKNDAQKYLPYLVEEAVYDDGIKAKIDFSELDILDIATVSGTLGVYPITVTTKNGTTATSRVIVFHAGNRVTFHSGVADIADQYHTGVKPGEKLVDNIAMHRNGFRLLGWAKADGSRWDFAVDTMPDASLELYALWQNIDSGTVVNPPDGAAVIPLPTSPGYRGDGKAPIYYNTVSVEAGSKDADKSESSDNNASSATKDENKSQEKNSNNTGNGNGNEQGLSADSSAGQQGTWAVANMILGLFALVLLGLQAFLVVKNRKRSSKPLTKALSLAGLVFGALIPVLFTFGSTFSGDFSAVDYMTAPLIILLGVQAACLISSGVFWKKA